MRWMALLVGFVLLPGAVCAQTSPSGDVQSAASGIRQEDFVRRIGVLAHDSMRGRETPSPGLTAAANWIADEFRRLGLTPGGDGGSFLQSYPVRMPAFSFSASGVRVSSGRSLAFGTDVLPLLLGPPSRAGSEGGVVLLTGAAEPAAIASLDLAQRAVIAFFPEPTSELARVRLAQALRARRPASVMFATTVPDDVWRSESERTEAARFPAVAAGGTPVLLVRDAALASLLGSSGVDVAELRRGASGPLQRRELANVTLSVTQELRQVEELAPNVVGLLEGSDPTLKDEYVVFSAHMDHVGIGPADARGDTIYNGADDNASGTTAVIELAEAMASLSVRPRRSILFVLVSGEEKGLWGSDWFAEHSPVPLERLVADVNIDMIGRNWPDTVVVIGREHSDLGATLGRVNDAHPELGMEAIDDLWPEERFFFRSDHYNFARRGVPALFFFNGVHADYHEPSDSPDKIDSEKAARIARLVFYLGLEIAGARERPRWNPESYRRIVQGSTGIR
jgi:hypothetical protein